MAKEVKIKKEPKPKKPKQIEPHWNKAVETWFKFTTDKFNAPPSFDGSAPRDLKCIITQLRQRAEAKNIEWSELALVTRLNAFLDAAYTYQYLRTHWLLLNINRQKDIIFFDLAKAYSKN
jgi:hypothetical protein